MNACQEGPAVSPDVLGPVTKLALYLAMLNEIQNHKIKSPVYDQGSKLGSYYFWTANFLAIIADTEITDGLDGESGFLAIACNHTRD